MNLHEETIAKINQLPEPLVEEVSDFLDFLLMKRDRIQWEMWKQFAEGTKMAESDFSDYLSNLQEYEERLARGEIQW
jgi:hypothetical protein